MSPEWHTKKKLMFCVFFMHISYYMGLKPRIMLADLDILKEVLVKEINIFTNRPVGL